MKNLIETLTELFNKTGLNQTQVAEKLGISPQLMGQYLKGRQNPKTDFWVKWHDVFGDDPLQMFSSRKTNVDKSTPDPESLYRDLVEANTEYRLIPKTVLEGEYRLMLNKEIEDAHQVRNALIESNRETIGLLKKRVDELERLLGLKSQKADK